MTPSEAKEKQTALRQRVKIEAFPETTQLIAGADISFNLQTKQVYAGMVLLTYPELEIKEKISAVSEIDFP